MRNNIGIYKHIPPRHYQITVTGKSPDGMIIFTFEEMRQQTLISRRKN